jgi:hypothetical protein
MLADGCISPADCVLGRQALGAAPGGGRVARAEVKQGGIPHSGAIFLRDAARVRDARSPLIGRL